MSRLPKSTDTLENLPTKKLGSGTFLYRVNSTDYDSPVFFSNARKNRWTPVEGTPGVCYLALSETGAIAESVCRDSAYLEEEEKSVSLQALAELRMYELIPEGAIEVLDLTVSNLSRYRLDSGILADYEPKLDPPYQYCPAWASHAVALGLQGILYRSRHAVEEFCLALFQGYHGRITYSPQGTLDNQDYLAILDEEFGWGIII